MKDSSMSIFYFSKHGPEPFVQESIFAHQNKKVDFSHKLSLEVSRKLIVYGKLCLPFVLQQFLQAHPTPRLANHRVYPYLILGELMEN